MLEEQEIDVNRGIERTARMHNGHVRTRTQDEEQFYLGFNESSLTARHPIVKGLDPLLAYCCRWWSA